MMGFGKAVMPLKDYQNGQTVRLEEKAYEQGPDSLMKWKDEQVARLDDLVQRTNIGLPELEGCSPLASDILRTYIFAEHLRNICDNYMLLDDKLRMDVT